MKGTTCTGHCDLDGVCDCEGRSMNSNNTASIPGDDTGTYWPGQYQYWSMQPVYPFPCQCNLCPHCGGYRAYQYQVYPTITWGAGSANIGNTWGGTKDYRS